MNAEDNRKLYSGAVDVAEAAGECTEACAAINNDAGELTEENLATLVDASERARDEAETLHGLAKDLLRGLNRIPIEDIDHSGRRVILMTHAPDSRFVAVGDHFTSVTDDSFRVTGGTAPKHHGSTGRVYCVKELEPSNQPAREFFPSVLGLEWA